MRVSTIALLLLSAALAGCLGGDDVETEATDTGTGGSVTGSVRMADGLLAVADARVALVKDGTEVLRARSDAEGIYLIENVPPDAYLLQVFALCCHQKVQTVTIEDDRQQEINFLLDRRGNLTLTPFVQGEGEAWNGMLSCAVMLPEVLPDFLPGPYFQCGQSDSSHDEQEDIELDALAVATVSVGMRWEGNAQLRITVMNAIGDYVYDEVTSTSPILIRIDDDTIEDEEMKFSYLHEEETPWSLKFDVRPGDPGVTYQQPFEVYYAIHYVEPAPNGYSPLPDA